MPIDFSKLPDQIDLSKLPDQQEIDLSGLPDIEKPSIFKPNLVTATSEQFTKKPSFISEFWKGINEPYKWAEPIVESAVSKTGIPKENPLRETYKQTLGAAFSPLGIGSELLVGMGGIIGASKYFGKGKLPQIISSPIENIAGEIPIRPINPVAEEIIQAKPRIRLNNDGTFTNLATGKTVNTKGELVSPTKMEAVIPPIEPELKPVDKLLTALEQSKPLNKIQAKIYSAERAERIAKVREVETPGIAGHYERLGKLKGEHTKVQIQPLADKLSDTDLDELTNQIYSSPKLMNFQQINATEGLKKLYEGQVPQPSEIKYLTEVFGNIFPESLIRKSAQIERSVVGQGMDLLRNVLTAYDFSAPGRQGKPFISRKEYWTSFDDMFKSWGSEKSYQGVMNSIYEHSNFQNVLNTEGKLQKSIAERAGLNLPPREEITVSKFGEKYIPGIRHSNRAHSAFLNKLRSDTFNSMVDLLEKQGRDVKNNDVLLKQLGNMINTNTGRGSLGKLERMAPVLNEAFFAPRLMASRMRMYGQILNPKFYTELDPIIRKESLRSLFATVGFGLLTGELARIAGAEISNDPTSSDFRKIRIGDTRIDTFSGLQQYGVGATKFLSGESTSSTSGLTTDLTTGEYGKLTRKDVVENFLANKLAPVPSFVYSWMRGREFDGMPFDAKQALINRTAPILSQDLYELIQEDPELLPLGILPIFGEGMQTYGR